MSFKAQKWAWEQKTPTPLTQLLLFAIAQSENDEKGYAWCSHQYLADKCRCSRRAVVQNIKYLETALYINVERQTNDGLKTTNHYSVNYSRCEPDAHHDVNDIHNRCEPASQWGSERGSHKQITLSNRLINSKSDQTAFDLWWQQYPKKVSKKEALKSWNKIKPDADLLIADTINKATNDDGWLRGYIPNPTTYLNQERWNDELQRPKPSEQSLPEQYAARKQRTAAIFQELNGCDVGDYVAPLLPAMVEDLW